MYQEWQGQAVDSLIDYSAHAWPDNVAIRMPEGDVTYAELAAGIRARREALARLGVGRGDHVATMMGLSPQWAEVFFATLEIGAVLVPMNLTWTERELVEGMTLTDAEHLVVESHYRGTDLFAMVERALPELAGATTDKIELDAVPTLRSVLALRAEGSTGDVPAYAGDLDAAPAPDAPPAGTNGPSVTPEDPALMLLTSGSTSFPKAAVLSHRAVMAGLAHYADGLEIDDRSVFVNCAPAYHIAGVLTLCTPLLRGACVVGMRWFDPAEALRLIEENRATHFWGFDTHFAMMRDCEEFGRRDVSSVQHTLAASNPGAAPSIVEMGFSHHGCVYGSTEYMGSQSFFPRRDARDVERMLTSHGRAMSAEIRIVDPDTGSVMPPGEPGEICVRGPGLFSGYYKRPDETAKCMDADGFFHSGDRGYLDEKGYLYYQGRYKEMIKTGGENVSILEVEQFLTKEVPGVRRAAVTGTPHPKWGEAVTALVVADPGLTAEAVVVSCRGRLAGYKIPKRVLFIDEPQWLVSPTGKIERRAMREIALKALEEGRIE